MKSLSILLLLFVSTGCCRHTEQQKIESFHNLSMVLREFRRGSYEDWDFTQFIDADGDEGIMALMEYHKFCVNETAFIGLMLRSSKLNKKKVAEYLNNSLVLLNDEMETIEEYLKDYMKEQKWALNQICLTISNCRVISGINYLPRNAWFLHRMIFA